MKLHNHKIFRTFLAATCFVALGLLSVCSPDDVTSELGTPPDAQFSAVVDANGYSVTLVNETSQKVIPYYSIPALGLGFSDLSGENLAVNFIFPGTYEIKMLVTGKNGIDSASTMVTTTVLNPNACAPGTAFGFIASCESKTWTLIPAAGAYKVGPGPNDGSWWSSGAGDVTGRSCEFNDEYTFDFASLEFTYESYDDFYGDGYLGDNSNTCQPESNYTATQAPWGSGTHSYTVIEGAGQAGLGQLKVVGLGAHIGLQKVRNGAEDTSGPAASITYDVLEMIEDDAGDVLVVGLNFGGGWWTFTLKEKI